MSCWFVDVGVLLAVSHSNHLPPKNAVTPESVVVLEKIAPLIRKEGRLLLEKV